MSSFQENDVLNNHTNEDLMYLESVLDKYVVLCFRKGLSNKEISKIYKVASGKITLDNIEHPDNIDLEDVSEFLDKERTKFYIDKNKIEHTFIAKRNNYKETIKEVEKYLYSVELLSTFMSSRSLELIQKKFRDSPTMTNNNKIEPNAANKEKIKLSIEDIDKIKELRVFKYPLFGDIEFNPSLALFVIGPTDTEIPRPILHRNATNPYFDKHGVFELRPNPLVEKIKPFIRTIRPRECRHPDHKGYFIHYVVPEFNVEEFSNYGRHREALISLGGSLESIESYISLDDIVSCLDNDEIPCREKVSSALYLIDPHNKEIKLTGEKGTIDHSELKNLLTFFEKFKN